MKKLITFLAIIGLISSVSIADDSHVPTIVTDEGFALVETLIDVPVASSSTLTNNPIGGITIATATLVNSGTTYVSGATMSGNKFTQPSFPRNVVVDVEFLSCEATSTCNGTLTLYGLDGNGNTVSEAISVSTNSATGKRGWGFISSYTLTGFTIVAASTGGVLAPISTCTIHIGSGNKIAIGDDIRASTDVFKFTIDQVDLSSTSYKLDGIDATYDLIDTSKSQIPDGSLDYRIWGKAWKYHLQ